MTMRTTVLAACAVAVAALALPMAEATGSQKTSKPRVDVESVAGTYIQPEPVWVPVQREGRNGRPIYLGMTVRIHPSSEHRFQACVLAPHVTDWIIVDFNRSPPTRKEYDDTTKITARITDLVNTKAGRGVFRQIEILQEHRTMDEASAALTETCK